MRESMCGVPVPFIIKCVEIASYEENTVDYVPIFMKRSIWCSNFGAWTMILKFLLVTILLYFVQNFTWICWKVYYLLHMYKIQENDMKFNVQVGKVQQLLAAWVPTWVPLQLRQLQVLPPQQNPKRRCSHLDLFPRGEKGLWRSLHSLDTAPASLDRRRSRECKVLRGLPPTQRTRLSSRMWVPTSDKTTLTKK